MRLRQKYKNAKKEIEWLKRFYPLLNIIIQLNTDMPHRYVVNPGFAVL